MLYVMHLLHLLFRTNRLHALLPYKDLITTLPDRTYLDKDILRSLKYTFTLHQAWLTNQYLQMAILVYVHLAQPWLVGPVHVVLLGLYYQTEFVSARRVLTTVDPPVLYVLQTAIALVEQHPLLHAEMG